MPDSTELYTIGYSGHTLDSLIGELRLHDITAVIDIRLTPLSRKPGFSKNRLHDALVAAGIAYFHIRALGTPKALREQVMRTKDYATFQREYHAHVVTQEQGLAEAADLIAVYRTCLLCVEAEPEHCHRSVVASVLAHQFGGKLAIYHLPASHPRSSPPVD